MESVKIDHFIRAIDDIGSHGDNDMLPFDIDTIFIAESKDKLAKIAFCFLRDLKRMEKQMLEIF